MRGFLKIFLTFLFFTFCATGNSPTEPLKEGQLIRRVYLDLLGIPPTSSELNWYLTYNRNGYEVAVKTIRSKYLPLFLSDEDVERFLSNSYKQSPQVLMPQNILDGIIRYQSGSFKNSPEEADKKFVTISLKAIEDDINPLDFMAENLMGRITTAQEENELQKIIKKYPSEYEGYLEALKKIKTYKDFTHK